MVSETRERVAYRLVGETSRAAIDAVLGASPTRTELAVFVLIVRALTTYSVLEDAMSIPALAAQAGCSERSARRAIKKFERLGVVSYVAGETPKGQHGEVRYPRVGLHPLASERQGEGGIQTPGPPWQKQGVPPGNATVSPLASGRHPSEKDPRKTEARAREIASARALGESRARTLDYTDADAAAEFDPAKAADPELARQSHDAYLAARRTSRLKGVS